MQVVSKIAFRSLSVLVLAYLGLGCAGYLDNLRGPFFPEILSDLNLRDDIGALFFSCASLLAFFASPLFDYFRRYLSALQIWAFGVLLMSFGFFLMSRASGVEVLFVFAAVFGLGFGTVSISQNILVFEHAPQHNRRRIFSGLHSMYGLASLASPVLAAHFMREQIPWRGAFALSSFVPLLLFILSLGFLSTRPKSIEIKPAEQKVSTALPHRLQIWLWAFINAFYLFAEISISSRLVLYLNRHQHMSLVDATQYLTIFFLTLWLGRLLFTFFHFRRFSTFQILAYSQIATAVCVALGLLWNPMCLAFAGLCLAPIFPFMMEYVTHLYGENCQKPISFVVGFGSLSIVLMHVVIGVVSEQWSLSAALWIGPLGLLLSLALMFASFRLTARYAQ